MRKILILCAFVLVGGAGALVWQLTRPRHYGPAFTEAPQTSIGDLLAKPEAHTDRDVRLEGTIVRQCPATGCWLYLRDASGKELRVEMSGVSPTFPQHVGGRAIVEGRLSKRADAYELDSKAVEFR